MTEISVKLFREGGQTLVAACDNNLLGGTFRQGRLKLEVKREFYGGNRATLGTTIDLLRDADVANLVGPKLVEAAVDAGLVDPGAVIKIDGVPHVQFVKL